jgi:hypothetical protein
VPQTSAYGLRLGRTALGKRVSLPAGERPAAAGTGPSSPALGSRAWTSTRSNPRDMAILVEIINGIGYATRRRIDFLHVPVPMSRKKASSFAPLSQWRRLPGPRLYLGLIHFDDRVGDAERIADAPRHRQLRDRQRMRLGAAPIPAAFWVCSRAIGRRHSRFLETGR